MGKRMAVNTGKRRSTKKTRCKRRSGDERGEGGGMEEGKGGAPVNSRNLHRKLEARLIHRVYSCAASQVYIYIVCIYICI